VTIRTARSTAAALCNLTLLAVGLASAVAAAPAHAQAVHPPAAGPYVGAAAGWGITGFKGEDFSPAAAGAGLGLPAGSLTGSDSPNQFGFKLNAGYRLNEWLGAELGFADLGKAKYDYRSPAVGGGAAVSYRTRAATLAGVAWLPVTNEISLHGKLGVAFTQAENDLSLTAGGTRQSSSDRKRKNNLYLGAGAEYRLTSNVSMVGEYEYFGTVGDRDNTGRARAQLVSLGLRYAL
jgi:OOP family OmpA-OmpF porin